MIMIHNFTMWVGKMLLRNFTKLQIKLGRYSVFLRCHRMKCWLVWITYGMMNLSVFIKVK
jgi:hypothetical protein